MGLSRTLGPPLIAKIPSPVIRMLYERLGDKKKDRSCEDLKTDRALRSLQSDPA
jgi:hypothetical protein